MSDKQLALMCVGLTVIIMLLPGAVVENLSELIKQWLPWRPASAPQGPGQLDKLIHAVVFAFCAFFVTRAWQGEFSLTMLGVLLAVFAVLTELAQVYIPGRSGDVLDIVADAAGLVAGGALALWYAREQKKARR